MTLSSRVADDQLGQFFRKTSAIADRLGKSLDFDDVMEGLQLIHDGKLKKAAKPETAIAQVLEFVQTVEVQGCDGFTAKEKFREGKTTDGVKIAWLGSNFKGNFLDGKGKVEESVSPATLRVHKLKTASLDAPMLAELGDTAETTLSQFWELLKKQGTGQKGPFLVNGYANIAYIRDMNGTLWAVDAGWGSGRGGWCVEAFSVSGPDGWRADCLVVSR